MEPGQRQPSEILDRLPAQNLEAERAILGCILLKPSLLASVHQIIEPTHFYAGAHEKIFRVMIQMQLEGNPIDKVILKERLKKAGYWEEIGGAGYIAEIAQSVPYAVHWRHYARIVKRAYAMRSAIQVCIELLCDFYTDHESPLTLCRRALRRFGKMRRWLKENGFEEGG